MQSNQGHSGVFLQSKLAPVSSMSGPNSHVIPFIMLLLVLLAVFLFDNVLTVPETITNIDNTFVNKVRLLKYRTYYDVTRHKLHMT